jgi:peptide/nickel transport system substrate-binding protein
MSHRPPRARMRPAFAALAATVIVVIAAGCGSSGSSSGGSGSSSGNSSSSTNAGSAVATSSTASHQPAPAGGNQTLTLALIQGSFTTFNPWGASAGINGTLWSMGALYDSLTRLSPAGTVEPGLATSWTLKGNTLKLKLRTGVKFSDGTPVNAAAVKTNLEFGASHPDGAECDAYIAGLKATVTSSSSLTVTTPHPVPGLLQDLAQCAGFIASPKALAHPAGLTSKPDGSGPYTLSQSGTVLGQKYTFVRRPGYWDVAVA